jgi:integrase
MSIHALKRQSGTVYKVIWRDELGRQRSRTFSLKRDAQAWDAKIKLAKRQGELAVLDAGRETLREFAVDWWRLHAELSLAPKTLQMYKGLRERHIEPRLGHLQLRALTPERIQQFQLELTQDGVGKETIRKTLAMLQGMLERAVEWGRIQRNPVKHVRKPSQGRTRTVSPLGPRAVEELRGVMLARGWLRDATLVSVLAYAGLRPGEALALRWGDIRERTLLVDKAISLGDEKTTKTGRSRTVHLLAPLASDLAAWRMASGRPGADALLFPRPDGQGWQDTDYRNWRKRRYREAAETIGLKDVRPYDLRHSLASILMAEQRNPAEIAAQLGHTLQTLFGTYAHVIEELRGREGVNAEEEIRAARLRKPIPDVARLLPGEVRAGAAEIVDVRENPA